MRSYFYGRAYCGPCNQETDCRKPVWLGITLLVLVLGVVPLGTVFVHQAWASLLNDSGGPNEGALVALTATTFVSAVAILATAFFGFQPHLPWVCRRCGRPVGT